MDGPSRYCPILFDETDNPVLLRCGHLFDKEELIKTLFYRQTHCPLCSAPFRQSDFMSLPERVVYKINIVIHRAEAGVRNYFIEIYNEMTSNRYFIFPTVYLSIIPSAVNTFLKIHEVEKRVCLPVYTSCRFLAVEMAAGVLSIYAQMFNGTFRPGIIQDEDRGSAFTTVCRNLLDFGQVAMTIGNPLLVMSHYFDNKEMEQAGTSLVAGGALISWSGSEIFLIKKSWKERTSWLQFFSRVSAFALLYGSICIFAYAFLLAGYHNFDEGKNGINS